MLKKSIIIISIGICAIVVASVLCYAFFVKPEPVVPAQPIVNNDAIPATTPDDISEVDSSDCEEIDYSEEINISNWKTYRNNEYGYEISYPKDWKLKEENENITMTSPETFKWFEEETARLGREPYAPSNDIIIFYYSSVEEEYVNKANKLGATTLEELIEKDNEINEIGKVQISSIDAVEIIRHGESSDYGILIEKSKHLYEIKFVFKGSREKLSEIEKRILSTFKFINN
jgi:hypothetical protein